MSATTELLLGALGRDSSHLPAPTSASNFTRPLALPSVSSLLCVSYRTLTTGFRVYPRHPGASPNYICKDPCAKQGPILRFQRSGRGHIFEGPCNAVQEMRELTGMKDPQRGARKSHGDDPLMGLDERPGPVKKVHVACEMGPGPESPGLWYRSAGLGDTRTARTLLGCRWGLECHVQSEPR